MFNILKKQKQPKQSEKEVAVIEQIHDEFDSSTDRLLQEAEEIISKMDMSALDKGERLSKLGFIATQEALFATIQKSQKQKNEELANYIMYYKTWYPNYKFINETEVERICKKWGLLCGLARWYKGSVPDKNVREMEAFRLRDDDKTKNEQAVDVYKMGGMEFSGENWHSHASKTPTGIHGLKLGVDYTKERIVLNTTYYQEPFKICAPEKDFDMTWLKKEGHNLSLNIPDPIVLQPVRGGYLVVTKWGIEAEDNGLINETHN